MLSRWFRRRKIKTSTVTRRSALQVEPLEGRLLFATRIWDGGGGNNNWNNAANWDALPVAGDDLVFNGTTRPNPVNDFAANTTFRSITFNTTGFTLSGNPVFIGQSITANSGSNTINLNVVTSKTDIINVGGINVPVPAESDPTITTASGAALTMNGVISGNGFITKNGTGTLVLAGNNSYTGLTSINAGTVNLRHNSALGTGSSTNLLEGATLEVQNGITVNEVLNTTTISFGVLGPTPVTLRNAGGTNTWSGQINLGANLNLSAAPGSQLTVSGLMRDSTGAGGESAIAAVVQKTDTGRVALSGFNTYTALTDVQQGALRLQNSSALGDVSLATTVAAGAAVEADFFEGGAEDFGLIINEPITLNGSGIGNTGALRNVSEFANTWAGTVTLATNSHIGVDAGGLLTITGVIGGSGELTKVGPSFLTMAGTLGNAYSGNTRVNEGTLLLSKSANVVAIPANTTLFIGDDTGGTNADVVRLTTTNQFGGTNAANSVNVVIVTSGLLDLNNQIDEVGNLTMTSGNVTTGTGIIGVRGNIQSNAAASPATISGKVALSTSHTITVADGTAADDLVIPAQLIGGNSAINTVTKLGPGRLVLAGPSTGFKQVVRVEQGTLTLQNDLALGDTADGLTPAGTQVLNGAALELGAGTDIGAELLTLNGSGVGGNGALRSVSGTTSWAGVITLASNATVRVDGANPSTDKLTLSGEIAGAADLTKTGTGTLVYAGSAPNTYTGQTTVSTGQLTLGKSADVEAVAAALNISSNAKVQLTARNQIDDAAPISINSNGELNLNDFVETIGPLTLTGGRAISGAGVQRLTLAGNVTTNASTTSSLIDLVSLGSASRTFTVADGAAAVDLVVNGVSGAAGVDAIKTGAGTMEASGTLAGTTRVNAGTVLVPQGKIIGDVIVNSGAAFGGEGQAKSIVSNGGRVTPGRSQTSAMLSTQQHLSLDRNSTYIVDISGTSPGAGGHDQLRITGNIELGDSELAVRAERLNSAVGDQIVIIENFSPDQVRGTFRDLPEGATLTVNGQLFQITYKGTSPVTGGIPANDVILTHIDAAPKFPNRTVTSLVREGQLVTVTGVPTDPDPLDQFFLEVNWGDGSPKEIFESPQGATTLSVTHRYTRDGVFVIDMLWRDQHGLFNTGKETTTVLNNDFLATAAGFGSQPTVRLYDPDTNTEIRTFFAFDERFLGGVRVAVGDVNADSVPDIIAAAGQSGGPHVRVFSGVDGAELMSFFAYNAGFTGGVFVAAGDVNNDGHDDIITGAGPGGGPHVRAFSGRDGSELASFFAYNPGFTGGVSVAAGDLDGDGHDDIITGAGPGGGPHVEAFSGRDNSVMLSFFAYNAGFTGGVFVAAGDVNHDGGIDIITGAGANAGPHVRAFDGRTAVELANFFAFDPTFTGGVTVGALDPEDDGLDDILVGAESSAAGNVRLFQPLTGQILDDFFAFDDDFRGGVFVGGS